MKLLRRLLRRIKRLRWPLTRPMAVDVWLDRLTGDPVSFVDTLIYQRPWYLPGVGVPRRKTLVKTARRIAADRLGANLAPLRLDRVHSSSCEHKSDQFIALFFSTSALTGDSLRVIVSLRFLSPIDRPKRRVPWITGEPPDYRDYLDGIWLPKAEV